MRFLKEQINQDSIYKLTKIASESEVVACKEQFLLLCLKSRDWGDGPRVKIVICSSRGLGLVSSTYLVAHNASSKGFGALSWSLRALHTMAYLHA